MRESGKGSMGPWIGRLRPLLAAGAIAMALAACGGGGSGPQGPRVALATPTPMAGVDNVMAVAVNAGPYGGSVDQVFTSLTLCPPASGACQTIPGILLDTGSFGLRLFSQVVSVPLPAQTAAGGEVGECAAFAGGSVAWGPVVSASITMGTEPGVTVPVQIMAASSFAPAPSNCADMGRLFSTPQSARFNGILGVGLFPTDHGAGLYYSCNAGNCTPFADTPAQDLVNPVAALPVDNNGLIVELPAVGAMGAASAAGAIVFGIGTAPNNALGSATVFTANSVGNFTTVFNGRALASSFIDSGSDGLFFADSSIPACGGGGAFFCPGATLALSAQNLGSNGATGTVNFQIANASKLFATGNTAFDNLGGAFRPASFDWGVPFFFGRDVYIGLQTPGSPPFWAY